MCSDHDWVSYGLFKQCRKCFFVSFDGPKVRCDVCNGEGKFYTKADLFRTAMTPWTFWSDPPVPRSCPKCKGSGFVVEERECPKS
jgi:DnaJ-class molecular chaperone